MILYNIEVCVCVCVKIRRMEKNPGEDEKSPNH